MNFQARPARGVGAHSGNEKLAKGLGWFSIALGVTELLGARGLCQRLGLQGSESLIRAFGLREAATGLAILSSHDATPWVWGRVGGDALDLTTLVGGAQSGRGERSFSAVALAAVASVTLIDIICAQRLSSEKGNRHTAVADYRDRSGFPRPAAEMRGAAHRHAAAPRVENDAALGAFS